MVGREGASFPLTLHLTLRLSSLHINSGFGRVQSSPGISSLFLGGGGVCGVVFLFGPGFPPQHPVSLCSRAFSVNTWSRQTTPGQIYCFSPLREKGKRRLRQGNGNPALCYCLTKNRKKIPSEGGGEASLTSVADTLKQQRGQDLQGRQGSCVWQEAR